MGGGGVKMLKKNPGLSRQKFSAGGLVPSTKSMLPAQVKVSKLIQAISEAELPYKIILLADLRC